MDNLTHSLFALTLARTPLARAGRGTTAALLLASNAPDIDIVATAGGAVKYLEWHRGMTHGPLGIAGLGVITAGLVWIGRRVIDQRGESTRSRRTADRVSSNRADDHDATFAMLVAVSIIGALLHVLMDVPTSYGIRLLSPFDWRWFAVDWMPIVDVYLLIVLVVGLLGRSTVSQRHAKATLVLLLMATDYGVRAYSHHQALELAPRLFGPTMPAPCDPPAASTSVVDSWPRPAPSSPPSGKRCLVEMAAMPSFTSPFTWRIVAQMSNAYEIHDIDILDRRYREPGDGSDAPWRTTLRYPNIWTPTVQRAAATRLGQVFLGFSRFPAARSASDSHGATIVRWTDMRFVGGPFALDQATPRTMPFTATVNVGADGRINGQTLGLR